MCEVMELPGHKELLSTSSPKHSTHLQKPQRQLEETTTMNGRHPEIVFLCQMKLEENKSCMTLRNKGDF